MTNIFYLIYFVQRLRPLSYNGTDVFLVCFSVMFPASYENIKEKWIPEILHYCQKTTFLIVGTQTDLREDAASIKKLADNYKKPITFQQGEKLAKETRAWKYVECSALSQVWDFNENVLFWKKTLKCNYLFEERAKKRFWRSNYCGPFTETSKAQHGF